MIIEYHRPKKIAEALELLARDEPLTKAMGGGSVLNAPSSEEFAVVDLQELGLDTLASKGKKLEIGATLALQTLRASPSIPIALAAAIEREANYTQRQLASVAGSLVAADGRSPFGIAMLALDAQLKLDPGNEGVSYGELLPLRIEALRGKLIRQVLISGRPRLAYEYVARSPADRPIVAIALARWPSGRTRLSVGGFGPMPRLVLDGQDASGLAEALENILDGASDEWGSGDYRKEAGSALLKRALAKFEG